MTNPISGGAYPPQPGSHPQQTPQYYTPPTPSGYLGAPPPPLPPKKTRLGRVVGGIVAVLVVLGGVGGTLYASGVFDADGGHKAEPHAAHTKPGKTRAYYKRAPGFCDALDLSALEEISSEVEGGRQETQGSSVKADQSIKCTDLFQGKLSDEGECLECAAIDYEVSLFGKGQTSAVKDEMDYYVKYDSNPENVAPGQDIELSTYHGKWEEGKSWCLQGSYEGDKRKDATQCLALVRDGNMVLQYQLSIATTKQPDKLDESTVLGMITDSITDTQKLLAA